jgi:hypothetical protein
VIVFVLDFLHTGCSLIEMTGYSLIPMREAMRDTRAHTRSQGKIINEVKFYKSYFLSKIFK